MRLPNNSIHAFYELLGNVSERYVDELDHGLTTPEEIQFLNGLKERRFSSDKEACIAIFGKSADHRFNKLKGKARQHLVSLILKGNVPRESSLAKIIPRISSDFAAFMVLSRKGQNKSAIYLGELIIATAIKHGLSEYITLTSAYLYEQYSIHTLNKKKANYFKNLHDIHSESFRLYQLARVRYAEFVKIFIVEITPGIKAYKKASKLLIGLEEHLEKTPSFDFHLYTYLIIVFKYYAIKDYEKMHSSALRAINYFSSLSSRNLIVENLFLKKSIEANLMLRNFKYCEDQLEVVLKNSIEGRNNWFNTLELLITLNIHRKQYSEACQTFIIGKSHHNYSKLQSTTEKRWGLIEAYINFLQLSGADPETPSMSRYKINKFINDTPQYAEDKKGRNIQLIIAQLLFYILDRNWDKLEEKMEALQKYSTRHLRKSELFRTQVFIKMLLEIPKRTYHPTAIIRHTVKYRKRLEEMAPNIEMNGSGLEIIPYEDLWELIIQNIVPPQYAKKVTKQ